MRRLLIVGMMLGLVASMVSVPAVANEDDIRRSGSCSGNSSWKVKLSPENGRIEVEFEVDQNRNGQEWRVVLKNDGDVFFRGTRTTQGPSGSFEVRKVTDNGDGEDRIVARAENVNSDELCKGAATF